MARVGREGAVRVGGRQRRELEQEAGLTTSVFRGLVVAIPGGEEGGLTWLQASFHGATVVGEVSEGVSHVVLEDGLGVEGARQERGKRLQEGRRLFHLVSSCWLDACVREGRLLAEVDFAV